MVDLQKHLHAALLAWSLNIGPTRLAEGDCTSVKRRVHRAPAVDGPPSRTTGTFTGRTDRGGHFCLSRFAAQTPSACTRTQTCIRVATQLHRGSPRDALRAGSANADGVAAPNDGATMGEASYPRIPRLSALAPRCSSRHRSGTRRPDAPFRRPGGRLPSRARRDSPRSHRLPTRLRAHCNVPGSRTCPVP